MAIYLSLGKYKILLFPHLDHEHPITSNIQFLLQQSAIKIHFITGTLSANDKQFYMAQITK